MKKYILLALFLAAPLQAEELHIRLKGGICGDCCTMKLFVSGVRNVKGAMRGESDLTLDYDPNITTPDKIIADLKKAGKEVTVLPAVTVTNTAQPKWVKPAERK
jgi:hypothetical protein